MAEQKLEAADTVTVACKIPNGLILRIGNMQTVSEPILGGGYRDVKKWQADPRQVFINGPKRAMESGDPLSPVSDGFALTFEVPAEFMAIWMEENKTSEIVTKGMICVSKNRNSLKAMTREGADTRTGLEPMAQSRDPRMPRHQQVEKAAS